MSRKLAMVEAGGWVHWAHEVFLSAACLQLKSPITDTSPWPSLQSPAGGSQLHP